MIGILTILNADKIVVIEKGEIYKQETLIEVIDEQLIEQVFVVRLK